MAFDEDGVAESETFEEAGSEKDLFGNIQAVENKGGGFAGEEEGRVDPESLKQPAPEASAESAVPSAPEAAAEPVMIPLHALQEERRYRQQLAQENQALRETTARFDERMRIAYEQEQARIQAAYQAEVEPPPDPAEDPLGHQIYTIEQRIAAQNAEIEQLRGYAGQADQVFRGQAVDNQLNVVAGWTRAREAQYRAAQPDYDDAYRFLLRSRAEEYNAIGMTPEQIETRLRRDQGEVIALATEYDQTGQPVGMPGNPCDIVYKLAQQRGFVPGQTRTDAAGRIVGSNGQAGQVVDGRQRMAAAQRAQRQTPGGRGGITTSGPLTVESIARMSDADIAQLSSTPQGRRLLDVAMGSR